MYGLVPAAQFKGLNATGMILSSDELSIDNIVLLSIAGLNHYSVIKSINDTTVLLADSAFGNIEMTREQFNELYSGYVLIVTNNSTNNTLNGTTLTNEQMQNIKGTNMAYVAGGALILAGPVGWTILGGILTGIVIYNHLIDPYLKRPKITTTATQQNSQNYPVVRSPTINSYTRARSPGNKYTPTGYVSRNGYVSTNNIRPVDLEYQRNYEKYTNRKSSELNKIIDTIPNKEEHDDKRIFIINQNKLLKDHQNRIKEFKNLVGGADPSDDDAKLIVKIITDGFKRMHRGSIKCKNGDMVGGMSDITVGVMEFHLGMGVWIQNL
ncbi:MAG: hypothetical protein KKF16_05280 [Euryarchaeota archaeon]|nr:hypothetical protein [Euryarchaeota archaeon]MBV1756193.1 hypothetical protein [Methanobacterium sp.]